MADRRLLTGIPIWVRVSTITVLVLAAVIVSSTMLGRSGIGGGGGHGSGGHTQPGATPRSIATHSGGSGDHTRSSNHH